MEFIFGTAGKMYLVFDERTAQGSLISGYNVIFEKKSNLSREALIDLICKQKNNKMGSYPKNNDNKSHSMPSELGDEESSSDSSASNSSSNSSVENWFRQDAADKG